MPETALTQISPHVYWLPPGPPDRPSLCAVVGSDHTLLLDAGSSPAHVRPLLDELAAMGASLPRYVALTHWHWDHVFGAAAVGAPVIAHRLTADRLAVLAEYDDWSNAALDARVQAGTEAIECARDVKSELPEPRQVNLVVPEIVFDTALELRLGGGVTCRIQHVGGDHSPDSTVIFVEPDRVLFVGDCLCEGSVYEPARCYTRRRLYPLLETLLGFNPRFVVEGHLSTVTPRAEFDALAAKLRLAGRLVAQLGADEAGVLAAAQAQTRQTPDEELREIVQAFIIGRAFE